jgi:hypothetical protein
MKRRNRFRMTVVRAIESLSAVLADDSFSVLVVPVLGPDEEFYGELPWPLIEPVSRLKGEVLVMATMTNTQRKRVHFKVKNRRGGPAKFDGTPEWFSDNSDVLRLEPAADGMSCYVYAVGPLTDTPVNVTMRADADLGAGVRPILGTIAFEITAGEAALIELQDDPAEEEPDEELNPPGETGTGTGGGSPVDQVNAGDIGGTVDPGAGQTGDGSQGSGPAEGGGTGTDAPDAGGQL